MDVEVRYTRGGLPRAIRPDAVDGRRAYLIKNVPLMRLTYQLQLGTAMAEQGGMQLIVVLPRRTRLSGDMRRFMAAHRAVKVRRAKRPWRWW